MTMRYGYNRALVSHNDMESNRNQTSELITTEKLQPVPYAKHICKLFKC